MLAGIIIRTYLSLLSVVMYADSGASSSTTELLAEYEHQLRQVRRVQATQQPEDCHAALCQRGERNRRQPRT